MAGAKKAPCGGLGGVFRKWGMGQTKTKVLKHNQSVAIIKVYTFINISLMFISQINLVYTFIISTFATDKGNNLNTTIMNYKEIITNVAKKLDPGLAINVTITTDEDLGEAHFVVAVIDYRDHKLRIQMTVPFIIYNETCIFMPFDWEDDLPTTAVDIDHIKWVSFPDDCTAIIINGLPRIFV